mmetsp:Transcript_14325/g.18094  ORF Transcript_14325/g.18094 Transcript_14325/m.18094 type:complete len:368 (-) Transcript_14325:257-1360(-)
MFGGYSESKLKPTLKMAVSRFNIASNKKTALMKQQMREIAKLLGERPNPKEEKARIRAEALIRDDGTIEAYEILQLSCELICERIKLITSTKTCPEDLVSTIATLIWASTRVDIKELVDIRKQFRAKYGKKFEQAALNNEGGILNERIVAKLSVQPPTAYLVQTYLEKIADQFEVDWTPTNPLTPDTMAAPMAAPVGYSVAVAGGTGLGGGVSAVGKPDGSVPSAPSFPPPPEAYPVSGSTVGGRQSDDVSEIGNASASILSTMGRGSKKNGSGGNKDTDDDDDDDHNHDDDNTGGGMIPVAEVMTSTPAAGTGTASATADIYIPAAPQNAKEDDIYIPPAPGAKTTGEDGGDNFDDLQARFANLKR